MSILRKPVAGGSKQSVAMVSVLTVLVLVVLFGMSRMQMDGLRESISPRVGYGRRHRFYAERGSIAISVIIPIIHQSAKLACVAVRGIDRQILHDPRIIELILVSRDRSMTDELEAECIPMLTAGGRASHRAAPVTIRVVELHLSDSAQTLGTKVIIEHIRAAVPQANPKVTHFLLLDESVQLPVSYPATIVDGLVEGLNLHVQYSVTSEPSPAPGIDLFASHVANAGRLGLSRSEKQKSDRKNIRPVAVQGEFYIWNGNKNFDVNCGYEATYGSSSGRPSYFIAPIPHQVCRSSSQSTPQLTPKGNVSSRNWQYRSVEYLSPSVLLVEATTLRKFASGDVWTASAIPHFLSDPVNMQDVKQCLAILSHSKAELDYLESFLDTIPLEEVRYLPDGGGLTSVTSDPILSSKVNGLGTILQTAKQHMDEWTLEFLNAAGPLVLGDGMAIYDNGGRNVSLDDVSSIIEGIAYSPIALAKGRDARLAAGEALLKDIYRCRSIPLPESSSQGHKLRDLNRGAFWFLSGLMRAEGKDMVVVSSTFSHSNPLNHIVIQQMEERHWYASLAVDLLPSSSSREGSVHSGSEDRKDLLIRPAKRLPPVPPANRFVDLHVIWDFVCCHCCGFSEEVGSYARSLYRRTNLHLTAQPNCFCEPDLDVYRRLAIQDGQLSFNTLPHRFGRNVSLPARGALNPTPMVWIEHQQPGFWTAHSRCPAPDVIIGRLMTEFSSIEAGWNESVMEHLDEVWVPSEFGRKAFIDAGVPDSMIAIIPESVDTHFFSPDRFRDNKMKLPDDIHQFNHWCNRPIDSSRSTYKFFSNFKWEPRKGWTFLFEAYWNAFRDDPQSNSVSLYVLSHYWHREKSKESNYNSTKIVMELRAWAHKTGLGPLEDFPHFCIVSDRLETYNLGQLFASVDSFVLPTRGEGWGLPSIQAMSMGLPVISTAWGGNLGFMTSENSFLIQLDGCEEVPVDSPYGYHVAKKWATPSVSHLTDLMRLVFVDRDYGKRVGEMARADIAAQFSEEAVADVVQRRLEIVRERYLGQEFNATRRRHRCAGNT